MTATPRSTAHPFHGVRAILLAGLLPAMMSGATARAVSPADAEGLVAAHNAVRAQVGQGELAWSQDMVQVAEAWAGQLEANPEWCKGLVHNPNRPQRTGENIHVANSDAGAEAIVGAWASEQQSFSPESGGCIGGQMCEHYIQVVWGETTELGCAVAMCSDAPQSDDTLHVTICNYRPGLLIGQRPF